MKKIFIVLLFILIIILLFNINSYSKTDDFYELSFEIINNNENKNFDIYLLLPKKYITFAIENDNLKIQYNGADTLKESNIPSISVDKEKVQDETYKDHGNEYVQILLDKNKKDTYTFNILSNYREIDMKFRIINEDRDLIAHIDNLKIENNKCEIQYDVEKNLIKQPDKKVFTFYTIILIVILIFIILVAICSYLNQRNK